MVPFVGVVWLILLFSGLSREERISPMFDVVNTSDSLPVVSLLPLTGSLTPADFQHVSYSPTLLLPVHWDASITADPEYQAGCECGFDSYFAEMCHWLPDLSSFTFVDRLHTSASVRDYLLREIVYDPVRNSCFLPWRAGWGLGWLSALALTDPSLALLGLELLQTIVLHDESDCDEDDC
jgi:hypothetical protein